MLHPLLFSVALPALAATLLVLAGWGPRQRLEKKVRWPGVVTPIAIGVAFVWAFCAEQGWPGLPPTAKWEWLLFVGVAATAIGLTWSLAQRPGALFAIATGVAAGWMLRLPGYDAVGFRIGHGITVAIFVAVLDRLAHRRPGPVLPFSLAIAFAATSGVAMGTSFAKLALMAAAVAATFGGIGIIASWRRTTHLGSGAMAVAGALLPSFLFVAVAYDYSDAPRLAFVLPSLGTLGLWLGELPGVRNRWWANALVALTVVLVTAALAVALAFQPSPEAAGW